MKPLDVAGGGQLVRMSSEEKSHRAREGKAKKELEKALAAEDAALRQEKKMREWDENGTRLTYDELITGENCRGCNEPIIDNLGDWPPLQKMSAEQRHVYEADKARYDEHHTSCRTKKGLRLGWSIAGSRTQHCGECCPPPPFAPSQLKTLAKILAPMLSRDKHEQDAWQLSMTCGHTTQRTQHGSNKTWSGSTTTCPTCKQTRGIIASRRLSGQAKQLEIEHRRIRAELNRAQEEYDLQSRKAETARKRLKSLEDKRHSLISESEDETS